MAGAETKKAGGGQVSVPKILEDILDRVNEVIEISSQLERGQFETHDKIKDLTERVDGMESRLDVIEETQKQANTRRFVRRKTN